MPSVRQTNFSGGEIDPKLWGRTDLPVFGRAVRRLMNFFPTKQGAVLSRPGTRYVGEAKLGYARLLKLIPFVYSDTQSYVLEFGLGYIRFISDGAYIESSPGVPYEVATGYLDTEVDALQWAQTGDIVTLAHPSHPALELARLAHANWALTAVSFEAAAPFFDDLTTPTNAEWEPMLLTPLPVADAERPEREWVIKVSSIYQDPSSGALLESLPFTVEHTFDGTYASATAPGTAPAKLAIYPGLPLTIRLTPTAVSAGGSGPYMPIAFNIYRGRGDVFGFVGQTKTTEYVDLGLEPDYATQPPLGTHPFQVSNASGLVTRTEEPTSVAFFEERRVWGGTEERPAGIFASATGDYYNHDRRTLHVSGEALEFELASRRRESIRSMAELGRLLVATGASIWSFGGTNGPLDFDNVSAKVIEGIGANRLPMLIIDGTALYCRNKGAGVRALVPAGNEAGFVGADLTLDAGHLFVGETVLGTTPAGGTTLTVSGSRTIKDWTYAEDPWGLVWVVRDDGVLLSLTYSRDREMWAWAQHETDGLVRNVCSVPEGDEDVVYLVVERTLPGGRKLYLERMSSRVRTGGADDDAAVDCALRYSGTPVASITGLSHLNGKEVYAVSKDGPVYGPLTVAAGTITLPEVPETPFVDLFNAPVIVMHIGLLFTPELESLDVVSAELRNKQKTVTHVGIELDQSRGLQVGPDFDNLKDWQQRTTADSYDGISAATTLVRMAMTGGWGEGARVALRQSLPLPVCVVGITREVSVGS